MNAQLLKAHSRTICLALAFIFSLVFTVHMAVSPLAPMADGAGYATRAFAHYGYLHSGQWGQFWHLLSRPHQSICPLHDLLFFALPQSVAGAGSYFALQNFTTYFLLAFAVGKLAEISHRPEWAPGVFILCGVNNVAFTDFYGFYLDMPFLALGLVVIVWQMEAWREPSRRASLLAGLGLGLLFFVKPANALIFVFTFGLTELLHTGFALRGQRREAPNGDHGFLERWVWTALGFIPLFCAALACGGAQSILLLIDQNEVHEKVTPLAATGLLRLFYFPLCLSAFYDVAILGGMLAIAFVFSRWWKSPKTGVGPGSFPIHFFLPVLLSYLVLGLFFSFWMLDKPMRSLLLVLPFFWMIFFWGWEKYRGRAGALFIVAFVYAGLVFAQKAFNIFKAKGQILEDNYQLTASSWTQMPAAWRTGLSLNQVICEMVRRHLPPRAVIGINSIELRNSLAWRLGSPDLLLGRTPRYEVRNVFNYKGAYYNQALVGADFLVLITFYSTQANKVSWMEAGELLDYASAQWCGENGAARLSELPQINNQTLGYQIHFVRPLDEDEVKRANVSTFNNMNPIEGCGVEPLEGHRYSYAEAMALVRAWGGKRF